MNPLYSFEPNTTPLNIRFGIALAFAAALGLVWWWVRRQDKTAPRWKGIVNLSFAFAILTALSTAFFYKMIAFQLKPIQFYANQMTIPQGTVAFSDIRQANLQEAQERSKINAEIVKSSTPVISIEAFDGKKYIISSEYYPIDTIWAVLKKQTR